MLERIIIAIVLFGIIIGFGVVIRLFGKRRFFKLSIYNLLPNIKPIELPTILYFWTKDCSNCKIQEQYLKKAKDIIQGSGNNLEILKYSSLESTELLTQLKINIIPTIILLDAKGDIIGFNQGLTNPKRIIEQYAKLNYK